MSDSREQPTPTLTETARRRADLYQAILTLERAAARPAVGRETEWANGVVAALDELAGELVDHVEITEHDGGLYDEIASVAPRLIHKVDALRSEHPVLQAETQALRGKLAGAAPSGDEETEQARREAQLLLGKLVKHRQRGADLIWEAYALDIGGVE